MAEDNPRSAWVRFAIEANVHNNKRPNFGVTEDRAQWDRKPRTYRENAPFINAIATWRINFDAENAAQHVVDLSADYDDPISNNTIQGHLDNCRALRDAQANLRDALTALHRAKALKSPQYYLNYVTQSRARLAERQTANDTVIANLEDAIANPPPASNEDESEDGDQPGTEDAGDATWVGGWFLGQGTFAKADLWVKQKDGVVVDVSARAVPLQPGPSS